MAFATKLLIDGKEIEVISYSFGFKKQVNEQSRPISLASFSGLEIVIESTESSEFEEWMKSEKPKDKIELQIFYPYLEGGSKIMTFYDCYLVGFQTIFSNNSHEPLEDRLRITSGGVKTPYSSIEYTTSWRKTFSQKTDYKSTTPIVAFNDEKKIEPTEKKHYDEQVKVIDKSGNPISDLFYCVEFNDKIILSDYTNKNGLTKRTLKKEKNEKFLYYWGDEALLKIEKK